LPAVLFSQNGELASAEILQIFRFGRRAFIAQTF
jgi:hypothetical protein